MWKFLELVIFQELYICKAEENIFGFFPNDSLVLVVIRGAYAFTCLSVPEIVGVLGFVCSSRC